MITIKEGKKEGRKEGRKGEEKDVHEVSSVTLSHF